MTTLTETAPAPVRRRRRLGGRLLGIYSGLVMVWLMFPIAVMIVFSFNDTQSKMNITWQGFTLHWYADPFGRYPDLTTGLVNSLIVAVSTAIIATALGTLVGLALGRYRFRGETSMNTLLFLAICSPEIIMGTSLLSMFLQIKFPLGHLTLIISHVMFSISFVAVTVRARAVTLDPALPEAARDLGAGSWATFWRITFPLILPGVTAGALLAFALSVDDFIISGFVYGSTITFPIWVYSASTRGIPPEANVMGTLIFAVGVVLAVVNAVAARRRPA